MTTRTHTKTAENFGATFQNTFTDDAAPAAGDNIQNTLDDLADEARKALSEVSEGNIRSVNGWVAYGKALNAGRELFPEDDKGFGHWVLLCQVGTVDVSRHERAAAMWAAANTDALFAAMKQHPGISTVRGLHAKWKALQKPAKHAPVEPAEPLPYATAKLRETMEKLQTLANHLSTDEGIRANAKRKIAALKAEADYGEVRASRADLFTDLTIALAVAVATGKPGAASRLRAALMKMYG